MALVLLLAVTMFIMSYEKSMGYLRTGLALLLPYMRAKGVASCVYHSRLMHGTFLLCYNCLDRLMVPHASQCCMLCIDIILYKCECILCSVSYLVHLCVGRFKNFPPWILSVY